MYWKSFPTAIALTFSFLITTGAISSAYTGLDATISIILGCVATAFCAWAVFLHHKAFVRIGVKHAMLGTLFWLALLMIVLPNLAMMLLLYGGDFALILAPLGIVLLPVIAVYYLLPYWVFGEELYLDETVIAPEGMTGVFASMVVWAVIIIAVFLLMSLLAGLLGQLRQMNT